MSTSPYKGSKERLVLGIDIGSTSSSVCIGHLCPGVVPSLRTVTSWPASPLDSKLPSLVAFGQNRTVCGAEVLAAETQRLVASGHLKVAEFFKLHLHPQSLKWEVDGTISSYLGEINLSTTTSYDIIPDFSAPPLPHGISIEKVYSTFIAYLVKHARAWFEANTLGGTGIWSRLSGEMQLVFGIPDGWDEHQCEKLKSAVVQSGIILSKSEADEQVEFLRESEASVHYALESEEVRDWMKAGIEFTVADLGGSTCDTCMYHVDSVSPKLVLREVKRSDSVQAGGVYVDRAAKKLVEEKLKSSRFTSASTLAAITSIFEKQTKRLFHGGNQTSIIKFGAHGDTDVSVGIQAGRLTLSSSEVASTFEFCKDEIIASVKSQIKMGSQTSRVVVMTGGFGESDYLHDELSASLVSEVIPVVKCSGNGNKPVAAGLVLWRLSSAVAARVVRCTYGSKIVKDIKLRPPGWRNRKTKTLADGEVYVTGGWSTDVQKGTVMASEAYWDSGYWLKYSTLDHLLRSAKTYSRDIYEYTGSEASPRWVTTAKGAWRPEFRKRCTVYADLSRIDYQQRVSDKGISYWQMEYWIRVFVAQTTLKARIVWIDRNGKTCEGPATLVFDETAPLSSPARRRTPK